jgi:uncharacterized protein
VNMTMRILVTGGSGLVGTRLVPSLVAKGYVVSKLVYSFNPTPGVLTWNPDKGQINPASLEGFDAVIHLAGENIADNRWSEEKKKKILDSRVIGTRLLCQTFALLKQPPKVFISASAIGYYGCRGDTLLTEESSGGQGFLAEVCREWEIASQFAVKQGIRVVNPRIGMILSANGGALKQMLLPFKFGLGGRLGSGQQYMSWIAIDDVIGALLLALSRDSIKGPINVVAPKPITNAEFTRVLGEVLHRPTIIPLPAFAARFAFGEMADELLLCSSRVEPKRLQHEGYQFLYPDLKNALKYLITKANFG